jgi:hypothetical protein
MTTSGCKRTIFSASIDVKDATTGSFAAAGG